MEKEREKNEGVREVGFGVVFWGWGKPTGGGEVGVRRSDDGVAVAREGDGEVGDSGEAGGIDRGKTGVGAVDVELKHCVRDGCGRGGAGMAGENWRF